MKSVIDANYITAAFPTEYQDVHVIAGVLKSYLRGLPNPLLTYRLYDDFVTAAQQPTEDKRKKAILNAVNQLPTGHYYNLRYLTKFLSILAQKSQHNKMSSQNIAIVMSPNLLWPMPDAVDTTDYVQEVNSTAAVNTIVELLVSDWNFFFDGEIEFYVTLTRDELFPDNGGFPFDRDPDNMTKSLHVTGSTTVSYQTHSRSSSHDASLILIDDTIKRSQSSSSLSDSSPPQSSPKPTVRRKHNKQVAPTPPPPSSSSSISSSSSSVQQRTALTENIINAKTKLTKTNSDCVHHTHPAIVDDSANNGLMMKPPESKANSSSQTTTVIRAKRFGSNDNLSKPDKPPRPAQSPAECQTLNRSTYRTKTDRTTIKPVALPRTSLNPARSSENVSDGNHPNDDDDNNVVFREKTEATENKPDKPAIPERPISLMRPPSFKGTLTQSQDNVHNSAADAPIKKTQSFRGSSSDNSKTLNGGGNSQTTLERTHIYNVDKKQVAIIDVGDNNGKNAIGGGDGNKPTDAPTTVQDDSATNVTQTELPATIHHVPPSPRGFDPKIKRPVVPAPPPPTLNRPKSDGDSTNL